VVSSILVILAALIPFVIWLIKNSAAKKADPAEQNQKRYEQIDSDIAKGDGVKAGVNGADDLDTLDRLQDRAGDKRGPNS